MEKIVRNKVLSWTFKIAITLIFIIIVNKSVSGKELHVISEHLSLYHILIAIFFSITGLIFQVKRWEIILRYQKFQANSTVAWKTILWGNLLAFITPGRLGELFRGLKIAENRTGDSLFAVIIDKLFIVTTVLFTGFVCLLIQILFFNIPITFKMKLFLVLVLLMSAVGFVLLSTGRVFGKNHIVSRYFNTVLLNLPRLFTPAGRRALFYSFSAHLCLVFQTAVLFIMFGCGNPIINSAAAGEAYGLMLFLPFTIGNMGVREGSFHFFLSHLDVCCHNNLLSLKATSLGVSLLILIMNIIAPAFVGLLWYLFDSSLRKKQMEST